jgi:hypothetical protein
MRAVSNISAVSPPLSVGWVKIPQGDGAFLVKPAPAVVVDEIGTREAAQILGLSQRRVQALCDEGVLVEGKDWRRNPASKRGAYRITRSAVIGLR